MSGARESPAAPIGGGGSAGIPPWVGDVGTAVWVTDRDGGIVCLNPRAEELLCSCAADCVGRRCWSVVAGVDPEGRPHCRPRCATRALAELHREIRPFPLGIANRSGTVRTVDVLAIPLRGTDLSGPQLVHCALDRGRGEQIERYLHKLASQPHAPPAAAQGPGTLTPREAQILALLAEAESPAHIAACLSLSRTTVRNHVQHILDKLCVHSVAQAVACHLLTRN